MCRVEFADKMAKHTVRPVLAAGSTVAANRMWAPVVVASVHSLLSDQHTDGHTSGHRYHSWYFLWCCSTDRCQRLCTERTHYAAPDS